MNSSGWNKRLIFLVTSGLIATGLSVLPVGVDAAAAKPAHIPKVHREKPLPHTDVERAADTAVRADAAPTSQVVPAAELPAAATAVVSFPSRRAERTGSTDVPGTPVRVSVSDRGTTPSALSLHLLAPKAAESMGVAGVVLDLSSDTKVGRATIAVDYTDFRNAFGADWSQRLRLFQYPACFLSRPESQACSTGTELPTSNDTTSHVLSTATSLSSWEPGTVTAGASAAGADRAAGTEQTAGTVRTVLVAQAATTGPNGDFTATSLAPSDSWPQGGATGGFNWSYPITLPTPGTGSAVAPEVSLGYNSQAVDGMNTTTNNQSSWIGEGWDYDPGYIERSYQTCQDDKSLNASQQIPEQCWAGPVVTLHLPEGPTTALVKDDSTGEWHAENDNGATVQLHTGANNGAHDGEYWTVTATDGTEYTFGLDRLPGSSADDATNSVWTEPVYNFGTGPCSGAAHSRCDDMAYRWNLDLVEDTNHNAAVYSYTRETNHYKADNGDRLSYTRGGHVQVIEYGLSTATNAGLFGAPAPQRVQFTTADRCFADCGQDSHWQDTPLDQQCGSDGTCDIRTPTFWTKDRLTKIATSYYTGSQYQTVDTYDLTQEFPNSSSDELLLDTITRTGWGGDDKIVTPTVAFGMSSRPNRIAGLDNETAMSRMRLVSIKTETGQTITVQYSGDAGQSGQAPAMCTASTVPSDLKNNATMCYPVKWTPPFGDQITDYFHKYVVTTVTVADDNATAPARVSKYKYIGSPAWHYTENEVLRSKFRTWSDFRGFSKVEVRTGNPDESLWTLASTTYFRGMDGDYMGPSAARRGVSISDSAGVAHDDLDALSGQPLETQSYTGDGGTVATKQINTFDVVATSATRGRGADDLPALRAQMARTTKAVSYTAKATGGWLTSTTKTTYDNLGRPTSVLSSATDATSNCVTTDYAVDSDGLITDKASRVLTYASACPDGSGSSLVKATRTYYDHQLLGVVTKGNPTEVGQQKQATPTAAFVTTHTSYDDFGRVVSSTVDNPGATPATRTTTTSYTPAGTGALTRIDTTLPQAGFTTTETLDPARGVATKYRDVDDLVTEGTYDALGRLTAVWKPGQTKGVTQATETYAYKVDRSGPLAVTTKTLVDRGDGIAPGYTTRVVLYDAFGAVRQAQADSGDGNRTVTDNFNDSHGWTVKTYDHWYTNGSPSTTLVKTVEANLPGYATTTFDGLGRPTQKRDWVGSTAVATTKTVYGGDRVTVLPPTGGVATTTISNGRGEKTAFQQYTVRPTVSGNVVSGGTAQRETYQYDSLGQQTAQTTGAGTTLASTWSASYDMLGRVTSATSPDAGTTSTTYYDTGETKSTTDGSHRVIAYDYDAMGRKLNKYSGSVGGTKLASWSYDDQLRGHADSATSYKNGTAYTTSVAGYDSAGRSLGTTVSFSAANFNTQYTTTQSWTSTGLLSSTTLASSKRADGSGLSPETLDYSYDALGRPESMVGLNVYVQDVTYTPYSEASQLVLGVNNQTTTLNYGYNARTRNVISAKMTGQWAVPQLERFQYSYDLVGNLTKTVDTQGGGSRAPKQTQCFSRDALQRLAAAWSALDDCAAGPTRSNKDTVVGGQQPYWKSWTYDQVGNRTKQVKHNLGSGSNLTTTYNSTSTAHPHAVTSAVNSGANTQKNRYSYNADGAMKTRTIGSNDPQQFTYGPDGSVDSIVSSSASTKFIQGADGSRLLRRDFDGTTNTTTLFLPGQEVTVTDDGHVQSVDRYYDFNGMTIGIRRNTSQVQFIFAGAGQSSQVSVNPLTGAVTRRYLDPYGVVLGSSGGTFPGSHSFLNKPENPMTGLIELGPRLYDRGLGRFTSVDPVVSQDDPQSNGYSYASNNPIVFGDPRGTEPTTSSMPSVPFPDQL